MAKVKISLKMANGVKARTIGELRDNFDIKKVVGHFLDGKLKNWLEARYYEEELEQVNTLTETDPNLARKLCEIFGIEYTEQKIDIESVRKENERLIKLKQYTDDEEIIANIDSVAFNQEELAELYDRGVEKIWLCEGEFKVPMAKLDKEHVKIGNPKVIFPITSRPKSNIPSGLADYIGYKYYYETQQYIVWEDYNGNLSVREANIMRKFFENTNLTDSEKTYQYKIYNKKTKNFSVVYYIGRNFKIHQNKIIYLTLDGLFSKDILTSATECIYQSNDLSREFQVDSGKVAFRKPRINGDLIVLDINNKDILFKLKIDERAYMHRSFEYLLFDNKLIYSDENRCIQQYDLVTKVTTNLYTYPVHENSYVSDLDPLLYIDKIWCYNNHVYFLHWDKQEWETRIGIINLNTKRIKFLNVSSDSYITIFESNTNLNMPYFVFRNNSKLFVFDMKNNNLDEIKRNLPSSRDQINVVGNYVYWGWYKDFPSYRADLYNSGATIKINN